MAQSGSRRARPSRAIINGTMAGGGMTPLILWGLHAAGVPLPTDPVAAAQIGGGVAAALASVVGWFSRGGRRGEAD